MSAGGYSRDDERPLLELPRAAPEIRAQIIADYGVNVGQFMSMAFNENPGGRPISVVVRGCAR